MGELRPITLRVGNDSILNDNAIDVNVLDYVDDDSIATVPISSSVCKPKCLFEDLQTLVSRLHDDFLT